MGRKRVNEETANARVARKRAAQREKRARRAEEPATAAETSTPPPSASEERAFVFVLPAGALARDVGGSGFCLAYAVFDQLRRLGADVPASPEALLEACFDVLLKLSDETLVAKGVDRVAVKKARED
jgi:hypothetical protein